MHIKIRLSLCSLALGSLLCLPGFAQTGKAAGRQDDTVRARRIKLTQDIEAKKVDGLSVTVYTLEGNTKREVIPTDTFRNHDKLTISLKANFDGYYYIINITPEGKKYLVFPTQEVKDNNNSIVADKLTWIPPQALSFEDATGIEVLQVIVSKDRIAFYDDGYRKWKDGEVPNTKQAAADELASNNSRVGVTETQEIAIPSSNGTVRPRKLVLDLPRKEDDKKDTVIAIPLTDGKGRMDARPAVFEFRFKHVK